VLAVSDDTALPVHRPVAVYYRQSIIHQVGNISTEIQTVDMVEHMKRMGWEEENIILVDMDAGISGTTKIDERRGMSELFRLITTDRIGAVSCQDEVRLFRDVTQIQVNIFIEACKSHYVLVITPSVVYNFSHPQMGTFHARQFRFKSEMAAEYIDAFVRGRLHRAIRRVAGSGRWVGAQMPAGYMVDNRKTLLSGAANR
jgi:DNA invertase Pin-like site-specific DNA recombinase